MKTIKTISGILLVILTLVFVANVFGQGQSVCGDGGDCTLRIENQCDCPYLVNVIVDDPCSEECGQFTVCPGPGGTPTCRTDTWQIEIPCDCTIILEITGKNGTEVKISNNTPDSTPYPSSETAPDCPNDDSGTVEFISQYHVLFNCD